MAKIAVLITDMFEDSEYAKPARAFRSSGHTMVHVGLQAEVTVTGKQQEIAVYVDVTSNDVAVNDFDALFIPGGYSPDKLRVCKSCLDLTRGFMQSGKPVFTICHAPQLLITADVIRGRRITGCESIVQDLKNAGADYVDNEVVVDGNLISSRHPGDLAAFIDACLSRLAQ
jgi:protease I